MRRYLKRAQVFKRMIALLLTMMMFIVQFCITPYAYEDTGGDQTSVGDGVSTPDNGEQNVGDGTPVKNGTDDEESGDLNGQSSEDNGSPDLKSDDEKNSTQPDSGQDGQLGNDVSTGEDGNPATVQNVGVNQTDAPITTTQATNYNVNNVGVLVPTTASTGQLYNGKVYFGISGLTGTINGLTIRVYLTMDNSAALADINKYLGSLNVATTTIYNVPITCDNILYSDTDHTDPASIYYHGTYFEIKFDPIGTVVGQDFGAGVPISFNFSFKNGVTPDGVQLTFTPEVGITDDSDIFAPVEFVINPDLNQPTVISMADVDWIETSKGVDANGTQSVELPAAQTLDDTAATTWENDTKPIIFYTNAKVTHQNQDQPIGQIWTSSVSLTKWITGDDRLTFTDVVPYYNGMEKQDGDTWTEDINTTDGNIYTLQYTITKDLTDPTKYTLTIKALQMNGDILDSNILPLDEIIQNIQFDLAVKAFTVSNIWNGVDDPSNIYKAMSAQIICKTTGEYTTVTEEDKTFTCSDATATITRKSNIQFVDDGINSQTLSKNVITSYPPEAAETTPLNLNPTYIKKDADGNILYSKYQQGDNVAFKLSNFGNEQKNSIPNFTLADTNWNPALVLTKIYTGQYTGTPFTYTITLTYTDGTTQIISNLPNTSTPITSSTNSSINITDVTAKDPATIKSVTWNFTSDTQPLPVGFAPIKDEEPVLIYTVDVPQNIASDNGANATYEFTAGNRATITYNYPDDTTPPYTVESSDAVDIYNPWNMETTLAKSINKLDADGNPIDNITNPSYNADDTVQYMLTITNKETDRALTNFTVTDIMDTKGDSSTDRAGILDLSTVSDITSQVIQINGVTISDNYKSNIDYTPETGTNSNVFEWKFNSPIALNPGDILTITYNVQILDKPNIPDGQRANLYNEFKVTYPTDKGTGTATPPAPDQPYASVGVPITPVLPLLGIRKTAIADDPTNPTANNPINTFNPGDSIKYSIEVLNGSDPTNGKPGKLLSNETIELYDNLPNVMDASTLTLDNIFISKDGGATYTSLGTIENDGTINGSNNIVAAIAPTPNYNGNSQLIKFTLTGVNMAINDIIRIDFTVQSITLTQDRKTGYYSNSSNFTNTVYLGAYNGKYLYDANLKFPPNSPKNNWAQVPNDKDGYPDGMTPDDISNIEIKNDWTLKINSDQISVDFYKAYSGGSGLAHYLQNPIQAVSVFQDSTYASTLYPVYWAGGNVRYDITFRNTDQKTVNIGYIVDRLPEKFTYIDFVPGDEIATGLYKGDQFNIYMNADGTSTTSTWKNHPNNQLGITIDNPTPKRFTEDYLEHNYVTFYLTDNLNPQEDLHLTGGDFITIHINASIASDYCTLQNAWDGDSDLTKADENNIYKVARNYAVCYPNGQSWKIDTNKYPQTVQEANDIDDWNDNNITTGETRLRTYADIAVVRDAIKPGIIKKVGTTSLNSNGDTVIPWDITLENSSADGKKVGTYDIYDSTNGNYPHSMKGTLVDILPEGFNYVSGSAYVKSLTSNTGNLVKISGNNALAANTKIEPVVDAIQINGQNRVRLTWDIQSFANSYYNNNYVKPVITISFNTTASSGIAPETYVNESYLIPTNNFASLDIADGTETYYPYDGNNNHSHSVVSIAEVNLSGAIGVYSYKTVERVEDPSVAAQEADILGTAKVRGSGIPGTNDPTNYINVRPGSTFKYSLNIENDSQNAYSYQGISIYDKLPIVGDKGTGRMSGTSRYSMWRPTLTGDPVTVTVYTHDSHGNIVLAPAANQPTASDYTIDYLADLAGNYNSTSLMSSAITGWTSTVPVLSDITAFRIVFADSFTLKSGDILKFEFTMKAPETMIAPADTANYPADSIDSDRRIAWNSFGYEFTAQNIADPLDKISYTYTASKDNSLEPKKVGVRFYYDGEIDITKQLSDPNGTQITNFGDRTFRITATRLILDSQNNLTLSTDPTDIHTVILSDSTSHSAKLTDLQYGQYAISETVTIKGVEYSNAGSAYDITISGTGVTKNANGVYIVTIDQTAKNVSIIVNNKQKAGNLEIDKVRHESDGKDYPHVGVVFGLLDTSAVTPKVVAYAVTGSNGKAYFDDNSIPFGTYTLFEVLYAGSSYSPAGAWTLADDTKTPYEQYRDPNKFPFTSVTNYPDKNTAWSASNVAVYTYNTPVTIDERSNLIHSDPTYGTINVTNNRGTGDFELTKTFGNGNLQIDPSTSPVIFKLAVSGTLPTDSTTYKLGYVSGTTASPYEYKYSVSGINPGNYTLYEFTDPKYQPDGANWTVQKYQYSNGSYGYLDNDPHSDTYGMMMYKYTNNPIIISVNSTTPVSVDVNNVVNLGKIVITKTINGNTSATTESQIKFTITDCPAAYTGTKEATFTAGNVSTFTFDNLPYGTYTIQESTDNPDVTPIAHPIIVTIPDGSPTYDIDTTTGAVIIEYDITANNIEDIGQLTVSKVIKDVNNQVTTNDYTYLVEILDNQGNTVIVNGVTIDSKTYVALNKDNTDGNGNPTPFTQTVNVDWGQTYTITEVGFITPTGVICLFTDPDHPEYADKYTVTYNSTGNGITSSPPTVTVANKNSVVSIIVTNTENVVNPQGSVTITKYIETLNSNGTVKDPAQLFTNPTIKFTLEQKTNGTYTVYGSPKSIDPITGKVTFESLEAGDYRIYESDAPDGYYLDKNPAHYTSQNLTNTQFTDNYIYFTVGVQIGQQDFFYDVINYTNSLTITKTWNGGTDAALNANTLFRLYRSADDTLIPTNSGTFTFTNIAPGDYDLYEICPIDYMPAPVTIQSDSYGWDLSPNWDNTNGTEMYILKAIVRVAADGAITVAGKSVAGIAVDNRNATLEIYKVATSNIPNLSTTYFTFTVTKKSDGSIVDLRPSNGITVTVIDTNNGGAAGTPQINSDLASGNIKLLSGESATITGLPFGDYTVTENNADSYSVTITTAISNTPINSNVPQPGTANVSLLDVQKRTVSFYNDAPTELDVTKNVTGGNVDPNHTFTFEITALDNNNPPQPYRVSLAPADGVTITVNGTVQVPVNNTFTLKNGETAVITGLAPGIPYTVHEILSGDDAKYFNDTYSPSGAVTLTPNTTANPSKTTVTVTNNLLYGDLTIYKKFGSYAPRPGDSNATVFHVILSTVINNVTRYLIFDSNNNFTSYGDRAQATSVAISVNNKAYLKFLPLGITVKIADELNLNSYYTYTVSSANGVAINSIGLNNQLTVTNTGSYTPQPTPGSLIITKTVVLNNGAVDTVGTFVFIITDTATGQPVDLRANGITVSDGNGVIVAIPTTVGTFTLQDGKYIKIDGLPIGGRYTITETDYSGQGFATSVSSSQTNLSTSRTVSITILGNTGTNVSFTNTKTGTPPPGSSTTTTGGGGGTTTTSSPNGTTQPTGTATTSSTTQPTVSKPTQPTTKPNTTPPPTSPTSENAELPTPPVPLVPATPEIVTEFPETNPPLASPPSPEDTKPNPNTSGTPTTGDNLFILIMLALASSTAFIIYRKNKRN
ncbi:MAG: SpaA isopeptide-forming pilin-related protein [Oscillospiraceae bacterium]|nr:SpaA isopeptide-forming pilin-related protein [Oscillospiraceae bacterium]